jgi:uracil-DNA glycosylase family 4
MNERIAEAYKAYRQVPELYPLAAESPFVPGEGPVPAPIMIVGEAPGSAEATVKRPFVGPAGRKLNEVLINAGIDRRYCYVTNAVKYWPPERDGSRALKMFEIWSSKPCLHAEIWEVLPTLILAFGSVATRALCGVDIGIMAYHGQMQYPTIFHPANQSPFTLKVLPLYHPSALLRRPELERDVEKALTATMGQIPLGDRHDDASR